MPAFLQSYQLYVSEVCCNVDAVRQWDWKILTKIRARQRSTIGKNRLLIVFYNGGKEQWTQLLRCRDPQRSVNQLRLESGEEERHGDFCHVCVRHENDRRWDARGAFPAAPNDDRRHAATGQYSQRKAWI